MGMRRFTSLMFGLPLDSALNRSRDPLHAGVGWNAQTEITALIAELVDYGNRLTIMTHSKRGDPLPAPLNIPRPYRTEKEKPKPASKKEIGRFFGQRGVVIADQKEVEPNA